MRVSELFLWTIKRLKITTLGYHLSDKESFRFYYPNKTQFQVVFDHKKGHVYDGVELPDIEVIQTEDILVDFNIDSVILDIATLSKYIPYKNMRRLDKNTALCLFVILHEIGHYLHLLSFKNEGEYIAFREEYQEKRKTIDFVRDGLTDAERLKCELQYRNLPGENYANIFAEKSFLNVLIKYWQEFGFPTITVSHKSNEK